MYLLDTDVISQSIKLRPESSVVRWLSGLPSEELRISAVSVEEIRYGTETLPTGRKRKELESWLNEDILVNFADRILPVDAAVADRCGRLVAAAKKRKHNPDLADALIASTALIHGLTVATLNRKHFEPLGVPLITF